jgi:hypothetical protein
VSEDGNRVKRDQPFTESDLEELQVIMSPLYIACHIHMLEFSHPLFMDKVYA